MTNIKIPLFQGRMCHKQRFKLKSHKIAKELLSYLKLKEKQSLTDGRVSRPRDIRSHSWLGLSKNTWHDCVFVLKTKKVCRVKYFTLGEMVGLMRDLRLKFFGQQIRVEGLLCVCHCCRLGYTAMSKTMPRSYGLYILKEEENNNQTNT